MGFGGEWRASNGYEPNHEAVFSGEVALASLITAIV